MKNFIKLTIGLMTIALVFGVFSTFIQDSTFADGVFTPETVLAWGSTCGGCGGVDGGDNGGGGGQFDPTPGCTDPTANNYNPNADVDNGSCVYTVPGCTDVTANNYNPNANQDDGSCTYDAVAPTCDSFTGNPTTLAHGGGSVTLTWATSNADSVAITGGVTGTSPDGFEVLTVTNTTTFTLTATGAGGTDTCTETITVSDPTPVLSCDSFDIAQAQVTPGSALSLTWATSNADSVSIDRGVGTVTADGTKSVTAPATDGTYTYTLTATKGADTVTCNDSVVVKTPDTTIFSCQNNVTFSGTPTSLPRGGGNVNFSWNVTDADSVSIAGLSSTAHSGSESVNVTSDRTFTLTATKAGFTTLSCPVTVTVETGGGGGGSTKPRCKLTVSDDKISVGQEITLTWDTTRARDVILKDDHGKTLLETDDSDKFDGEMKVTPTKDTKYTLISKRGVKERTCEVEVDITNNVTVLETRSQEPRVAGISLTQVPYTGFEAGPALTMIFYFILTIWGLFVAYIFVIRRDSIGGVSLAGAHDHVTYTDVSTDADPETNEPIAQEYMEEVVASSVVPADLPIATPVVGYAATMTEEETDESIEMTELENKAHAQKVLLSSDAMRFFMNATDAEQRSEKLDAVIAEAKASFPSEDGWVALNLARIESLSANDIAEAEVKEQTDPITAGSLAEAIVEGNIVAAYQMIEHRPMIALADAAADLDAVYRARKGEKVSVSDMLLKGTEGLTNAQLEDAIASLTGAVDGTYSSEAEAVKMAILKAVKAVA
jgi:plastocyanin